ncbi:hypothetical protein AGABI1DRAFT_116147 [Agaricus bisporus var. burnettii JB137-S8]|uniref:GH18 domain-containing protein n=1 Tax=Agaricus bisporus var. burnettii (strain JB137-S8 / ATCC MYA-4627 / FGSC 10392) TaxID=597362 RepID=K5WYY5_AGABU|nr:uncharacterized protein AGABI1DRAFT_116147 [Agaricus bisporus var. burnettii JB137-S8]EKM75822.1 hypothetical protein AGABI1DRAFT_116147 [Agaricus bisporus var. burnettii JB137-S8]
MKAFLVIVALTSFVFGAPTCSRQRPSSGINSAASNATATSQTQSKLVTGWYGGWYGSRASDKFTASQIPWEKYSYVTYGFAVPSEDVQQNLELPDGEAAFNDFIEQARAKNVKTMISVGGWSGSRFFSSSVATADSRTAFAKALLNFTTVHNMSGIDFDWEFPNKQGMGCNVISDNDTANFLELLKIVRQQAPEGFKLTAAVGITPWNGPDGNPLTDVSEFAKVLDHIEIMGYDVYGATFSKVAGPNAPLDDSCAPTDQQTGSVTSALKQWTAAGFSSNQIMLGVASYGHGFRVPNSSIGNDPQKLAQFPSLAEDQTILGTAEAPGDYGQLDICGNTTGPGGVFEYGDMVKRGIIDSKGNGVGGLLFQYDECSQTAYVYNSTSEILINYDSTQSFVAKGEFIRENDLAGLAMWNVGSDTSDNSLLDAITSSMNAE